MIILLAINYIKGSKFSIEIVILNELIVSFVVFTITVFMHNWDYNKFQSNNAKNKSIVIKKYFAYNIKIFTSGLLKSGNKKIDNIMIGIFISPYDVGVYDKIKKLIIPINILSQPFRELIYPKFLDVINNKGIKEGKTLIFKTSGIIVGLSVIYLVLILVLKEKYFEFSGINLTEENNLMLLALIFSGLYLSIFWWNRLFSSSTNPVYSLIGNLISTLVIMISSFIFLLHYGYIGYAYSIFLNYSILSIYWSFIFFNYENNKNNTQ